MPHSEVPVGKKLMAASIATARGAYNRANDVDSPRSSKKGKTSSGSSSMEATPRLKFFISYRSDELAPDVMTMLLPEVQTASGTFYKYWTEHWQLFVESSKFVDVFMTMVS